VAQTLIRTRRRWLILTVAAVVVLFILLSALSGLYVDLLWFREVHFSGVFWRVFWAKALLGVVFGVLFFLLLFSNLVIVRRLAPRFRPFSPEQELMERYRAAFEPYAGWIILGFSALIAIFVGISAAGQWQTYLLWRSVHHVTFGQLDPLFHRDSSFYIFVLPFQKFIQGWLFGALVGITVIVTIAHYLTGGIRLQTPGEKVTPQVRGHLSVLLGLIVLVKAWGYFLGKFDLLTSARGVVTGASYTDIHAQLPALRLLVFIAIACAILFLVNVRYRIWALPILGLGLLILVSIVAGAIVPASVQRFSVGPQELQKEALYINRNIKATRYAFGINVDPTTLSPAADLTSAQVGANDATVKNIRLWAPDILKGTLQAVQRIQPYYEFSDVDVDRYPVSGEPRVVMVSAREVSQKGIPGSPGWQSSHLIYTHGYGAVATLVNTSDTSGAPVYLLQDIPPVGTDISLQATPPNDHGSQVYFGELSDVPYVIPDTKQPELNFVSSTGAGSVNTTYQGTGGIPIGSFFRRMVFAYRYRDFNLLISGLIDKDSKILINRDINARVRKAAPFLRYDGDPYTAIVDGRIMYIWDAYTTTDLYPHSQRVALGASTNGDMSGGANYIRNSVKVVMDAYNGTLKFFVVDPTDPLIRVWENVFPHLFTPVSQASPELVAHFRYPEDLLQIQATQYSRYHVTDAPTFFNNGRRWQVPSALPITPGGSSTGTLRPYYVIIKLPGQSSEQFVLFEPFTPSGRQNMVAYFAAGSDPGQYGKLTAFQFPSGENVDGPAQVRSLLVQDPTVSQQITLLNREGSQVVFGDLLIVPIEDSFLYVQPIFVISATQPPIPELKRVVVVHGGNVSVANSLSDALAMSFGQQVTPPTGTPPPTGGTKVSQLLAQALQHFQAAEAALKAGNLALYQQEINLAQQLVQQASQLTAQSGASPSPSPSPSP